MKHKLLILMLTLITTHICSAQVIFDPASYTGSLPANISIVDIDGESYCQIVLDEWNNFIELDPLIIQKSTSFTVEAKYAVGTPGTYVLSNINTFLKLVSPGGDEIGTSGAQSVTDFTLFTVDIAHQDTIGKIQVAGQERTTWGAVTGDTLWIGKVTVLPSFERVITRETFGDVNRDTDGPNYGTGGYATHWNWNEITSLTSTNGHIEGGSDSSLRVNSYEDYPGKPASWREPSTLPHVLIANRPSYSGSWDTLKYLGIDIQGYKVTTLEFGYARSRTLTSKDTVVTDILYSVDGGAWVQIDTSLIDSLGYMNWDYVLLPLGGFEGETLDILFAAMKTDQTFIDDITVVGDLVLSDSMMISTSEDTISTSNGTAQLSVIVYPANSRQAVAWSVSSVIATIDENGLLTAISNGIITVTATTADGLTASMPIVIYGQKPTPMPVAINVAGFAEDSLDYTGSVTIGWETDSIFIDIIVTDDNIVKGSSAENSYLVDNIEIYFDMDNSKNIHWPRNGGWVATPDPVYDVNDNQLRLVLGVDSIVDYSNKAFPAKIVNTIIDTGYTYNVSIAWDDLIDGFIPEAGTRIGFDILISDYDSVSSDSVSNQFTWSCPTDKAFNDPSLWGTLEFIEGGAFLPVIDNEPPSTPANLAGIFYNASATITWDASIDNTGVMSYIIKQGIFNIDTIFAKQTGNTYTVTNLLAKQYSHQVFAIDNHGNKSAGSNTVYSEICCICCDDIDPSINETEYSIYPNPVGHELKINNASSLAMVELLGINGNVISTDKYNSEEFITITTSELARGLYFLRMTNKEGKVVMSKFVKE